MWNITSNICGIDGRVWQGVTPFQGWLARLAFGVFSQGAALGFSVLAFQAKPRVLLQKRRKDCYALSGLGGRGHITQGDALGNYLSPFQGDGALELQRPGSYVTFFGFLLPIKLDMSHLVTCISEPTYHLIINLFTGK